MTGNVIDLKKHAKQRRVRTADGKTLCSRGFHQWQVEPGTPFDVKSGKLITRSRCGRCGAKRTELR